MRITFRSRGYADDDGIEKNEAYAESLGFPSFGEAERQRLAVVGGGPSIDGLADEIRSFDGDVWAINGAWQWCEANGIDATFFTIDQHPVVADLCKGVRRGLIAMCCDRAVFKALQGASLEAVRVGGKSGWPCGPSSASAVPFIAAHKGYREVTFYGCESSFDSGSHAYPGSMRDDLLLVRCNGQEFMTFPGMMMQAEFMAKQITAAPEFLKERSGGLLRAAIADPDIDVLAATKRIHDGLA